MKKLSVLLLATVFVVGLVVQAGAQEQGPHKVFVDAFTVEDPVITFDELAGAYECYEGVFPELIDFEYEQEFGVSFSGSLFGEKNWAPFFAFKLAASNFNICEFNGDIPGEPVMVKFDPPVTRAGFLGLSPYGGITVTPFRDGVATADPVFFDTPLGGQTFIGIEDFEGIDEIKIEGDGMLYGKESIFWIDDLRFGGTLESDPAEIEVSMNVNPPSCSGTSINMKSKGMTPVVIAGSEDFDVTMIDPASIQLHGVAPVRSAIEDVPYCNNDRDGYMDLTLKFDTQELVDAVSASLGDGVTLQNDDWPILHLTGSLVDGTTIYADEPVSVKGKPREENKRKGKKHWSDRGSRHDRGHHHGWDNNRGHHKGWDKHR